MSHIIQTRQARPWLQPDILFKLSSLAQKERENLNILHGFTMNVSLKLKFSSLNQLTHFAPNRWYRKEKPRIRKNKQRKFQRHRQKMISIRVKKALVKSKFLSTVNILPYRKETLSFPRSLDRSLSRRQSSQWHGYKRGSWYLHVWGLLRYRKQIFYVRLLTLAFLFRVTIPRLPPLTGLSYSLEVTPTFRWLSP